MKNDVEVDYGRNSVLPQPCFSLLLSDFSQYMKAKPLPSAPSRLFIGNEGTWLISSSPRRAGYFTPKSFRGLGKPKASPGSEKAPKGPFCPPF